MKHRENALKLLKSLEQAYPDAHCALNYRSPWELLVATILSAQCTDVRVNQVTVDLFRVYPDPASLAVAPQEDVEALIRSTGFFRNKAKNLIRCASQVLVKHGGEVPQTLEELVALDGAAAFFPRLDAAVEIAFDAVEADAGELDDGVVHERVLAGLR